MGGAGMRPRFWIMVPLAALALSLPGLSPARSLVLKIVVSRANIRSGPSTEYPVISSAKRGEVFGIDDQEGRWYRINLEDGRGGWIHEKLVAEDIVEDYPDEVSKSIEDDLDVTGDDLEGVTYELTVKIKVANIRQKPSTGSPVVGSAKFAEVYEMLEEVDGWYHITVSEGKAGYIHASLVDKKIKSNPALNTYRKLKNLSKDYDRRKGEMIHFQSQGFFPSLGFPNRFSDIRMEREVDGRSMMVIDFHQVMKDVSTLKEIGEAPRFYLPETDRLFLKFCLITAMAEETVEKTRINLMLSRLNLLGAIEYFPAGWLALDREGFRTFMEGPEDEAAFLAVVDEHIDHDSWIGVKP